MRAFIAKKQSYEHLFDVFLQIMPQAAINVTHFSKQDLFSKPSKVNEENWVTDWPMKENYGIMNSRPNSSKTIDCLRIFLA